PEPQPTLPERGPTPGPRAWTSPGARLLSSDRAGAEGHGEVLGLADPPLVGGHGCGDCDGAHEHAVVGRDGRGQTAGAGHELLMLPGDAARSDLLELGAQLVGAAVGAGPRSRHRLSSPGSFCLRRASCPARIKVP